MRGPRAQAAGSFKEEKGRARKNEAQRRLAVLGRVLAILRITRGLSQSGLARRSGVKRASISEYERGQVAPDASTLERLLSAMGLHWAALDFGKWFLDRLEDDCRISGAEPIGAGASFRTASTLAAWLHADVAAAHHTAATLSHLVSTLESEAETSQMPLYALRIAGEDKRSEERGAAKREWHRLKLLPPGQRGEALLAVPPEVRWALSELLCVESQRLCGTDPIRAGSLAELALAAADLVDDDAFRAKLRGLALAHVGNALRARGDLGAADRTFASAEDQWEVGKSAEPGLLEEGLIYALKSSLRRAQRRFEEAAELLTRAADLAGSPTFRVQVQVSQAKLLAEEGRLEEAAALLMRLKDSVSPDEEPRVLFPIWHNLSDTLSKLERFAEAAELLPEARRYCQATGGELNRLRLSWTEARITTGLGVVEEGMALLARVRGEFASRAMAYDNALVSLELAVAYASEGRADRVKTLARNMAPIFQAQEVHREALATLTLFRQAAEREGVTASFARDVLRYLRKARHEPDLRFEAQSLD